MRGAELAAAMLLAACSSNPSRLPAAATGPEAGLLTAPSPTDAQEDPRMYLDDLLARASNSTFDSYDPGAVIAAVNALVPLGKDGALAAIDGFLTKQDLAKDPRQGLFLVLRVLFEADPHPPMRLGGSRPPAPASGLPRFPIAVVDDVPLLLVTGYTLRGLPEPVTAHVEYYRAHGVVRAAPLAPAPGPDRLAGYEAQYQVAYGTAPSADERAQIRAQLDRVKL